MSKDTSLTLKSLKKITDELAKNLEITFGTSVCKMCGHDPKKLYKAVENLFKQHEEQVREEVINIVKVAKFELNKSEEEIEEWLKKKE